MSTMKRKLVGTCPACGKEAFGVVKSHAVHGWLKIGNTVVPDPHRVCELRDGQTLLNRRMETIDLDAPSVVSRTIIVHSLSAGPKEKRTRLVKSAGKPGLLARLVGVVKNEHR